MDHKTAEKITSAFLRYLRELRPFPDEDEGLDEWRLSLWTEALGPSYSHLAGALVEIQKLLEFYPRIFFILPDGRLLGNVCDVLYYYKFGNHLE